MLGMQWTVGTMSESIKKAKEKEFTWNFIRCHSSTYALSREGFREAWEDESLGGDRGRRGA